MDRKMYGVLLILFFAFISSVKVFAALQPFNVWAKTKIIRDGYPKYEYREHTYNFKVEVMSDEEGGKREGLKNGKPYIEANPQERYAVILHNPMPIRVAVNLTIDGLNSINGKPCRPHEGPKWIVEPYSYVTIRGWQVNGIDARRFYFTSKDESYAKWRSNSWGKDLSINCGVIGAAFFFSKRELEEYFEHNPLYEYSPAPHPWANSLRKKNAPCDAESGISRGDRREEKAGTGMGERESHPVEMVKFNYDTGMYKPHQAVVIFYDFAKLPLLPQPFLEGGFAPEM